MVMIVAKMVPADNNGDDSDDSPMGEPAAGDDRREGFLAPLDAAANIRVDQNLCYWDYHGR